VYTTALPAAVVAASRAAVELVGSAEGERLRRRLAGHIERFAAGLADLGLLAAGAGTTPIFPVRVGGDRQVMECSRRLLADGVYAQGIRPPTVPAGTARLRFALMATHTEADLEVALASLRRLRTGGLLDGRDG
jgi:7-keto-8-aminopelargonate synthetase-like enzyme